MVLDALALLVIVLKGSVFDCMVLYAISEHMLLNGFVKKNGMVYYWMVLRDIVSQGMVLEGIVQCII